MDTFFPTLSLGYVMLWCICLFAAHFNRGRPRLILVFHLCSESELCFETAIAFREPTGFCVTLTVVVEVHYCETLTSTTEEKRTALATSREQEE